MATALQIVQRLYPNVTEVRDSKKALRIEVTSGDCKSRAVKNHKDCALAVAAKRLAEGAIICIKTAYLINGTKAVRYKLPESVSREIAAFDRNAPFEPGEYNLSAVPPSSELGINKMTRGANKIAKKRAHYHRTENIRGLVE